MAEFITSELLWKENKGGGWFAITVVSFIFLWQLWKFLYSYSIARFRPTNPVSYVSVSSQAEDSSSSSRVSELVSDGDLKTLIDNLDEIANPTESWENVVEKSKNSLSYKAKCSKQKDGPLKYLSVTVFENCSPEILRDFYMDCDFRTQWDKTVVAHKQLQIDNTSGVEIGRTIKKFPLLTPREYVLAWKVWEGSNKTFYCFTKECEHPLAPRQKKYVRVAFFRSGWRIRQVPGRNACEIKLVHQEDAGFNVEVAKMAFARGIWNFVCKMEDAFRKYALSHHRQSNLAISAVTLVQKVPPDLDTMNSAASSGMTTASSNAIHPQEIGGASSQRIRRKPTKKMIANGLLLAGSLVCLTRGHSSLGAQVVVAYILKKLSKRGSLSGQNQHS